MNVETMPAGREMDALVAEKVMGLNLKDSELGFVTHLQEWWFVSGPLANTRLEGYSTEIAAAWKVLERMTERISADMEYGVAGSDKLGWCVYELEGHDLNAIAQGKTAPLAICRAALGAVL